MLKRLTLNGLGAMVLLASLLACTNGDPERSATQTSNAVTSAPTITEQWRSIEPGGDTTCSDGSAYKFFARSGDADKLMVFFQGGGGCWTRETCDPAGEPTYYVNIPEDFAPQPFGAFNFDNPDNPFKNHTVVMASYCTGDVHLGASDTVYPGTEENEQPITIRHQGRANAQAVLEWTYANVPDAKEIFVTGSSAGAIPSPYYAALVADAYPAAQVAHLGDGAGGYRRLNGNARPDEQWGTFNFINESRGFETLVGDGFNYEKLYIAAAKAHPNITFAEYDAAEDRVQKNFLALGGIKDVSLHESLRANHADIQAAVPNFRSFISGGDSHTILRRPEFYSYGVPGNSVVDWVAQLTRFEDVSDVSCNDCSKDTYGGAPVAAPMRVMWDAWEDPEQQYIEPFKIFDNIYYVGIDWVAAYVIDTGEGLILIDSLYGKWVNVLVRNMHKLGLDPADVKYVINTHGHFDHAGGDAYFQAVHGARIVMSEEDWKLAETKAEAPMLYMPIPKRDIVAADGDTISLGDTTIDLFKTPGHTEGVLTMRYQVRDGQDAYTAITLGGVGLNFSGVERTETYLKSYARLQELQDGVSVSLPNHASMGGVFERAAALAQRQPGQPHPFVDAAGYQASLNTFIGRAEQKLAAEKAGTAQDPLEELSQALED